MRLTLTELAAAVALVLMGILLAVGAVLAWTLPRSHPALWTTALTVCALAGTVYALIRRSKSRPRQAAMLQSANDELVGRVAAQTSALRDTNARLQSIVDSAVDGIIVIDAVGRIDSFNPGAEQLFGYAASEVVGRNVTILMPSPYREEHDGYLSRYLGTGERHIIGIGREVSAVRKDGTTFPVHLSVGEMTIEDKRYYTGIIHDLTARVRVEAELRERAALARLGEMAAVLAHEVKNPLAAVRGAIQVIGGRLSESDAWIVKEIIARLDALNDLMRDLLLFARPPRIRPAPLDLPALLANTAALLRQDPAFAGLRIAIEGTAPPIVGDIDLLSSVFQNLLLNAAQAMQGRGTVHVDVVSPDGWCEIVVSDAGPGIPAEVQEKLFTPFFTTKARGTGLGLSTARRIVEEHGGTIAVECPRDGGTRVIIRLPGGAAAAPPA